MRYSPRELSSKVHGDSKTEPQGKNTISEDSLAAASFVGFAPTAYCFTGFWLFSASVDPSDCGNRRIPGAVESHLAVHLTWPEGSASYLLVMGPFPLRAEGSELEKASDQNANVCS